MNVLFKFFQKKIFFPFDFANIKDSTAILYAFLGFVVLSKSYGVLKDFYGSVGNSRIDDSS